MSKYTWENIKICGRHDKINCSCGFGYYKANAVYSNFFEFLKSIFKRR